MPDVPEWTQLDALIKGVAKHQHNSPSFEPHITLWYPIAITTSPEEIVTALRDIVSQWKSQTGADKPGLPLELGDPQTGEYYYQCVLAPVQPTDALLALRRIVEAKWGPTTKEYFPHLSLMYGDVEEAEREKVAHELQAANVPRSITCSMIAVVDSRGPADQWKIVDRVQL